MLSINDLLAVLDHWPVWKKIKAAPEQVEALEKRIADLEKRLERCPGEGCPKCGELTFRTVSSGPHRLMGQAGVIERQMKCEKCGFEESHTITTASQRPRR